MPGLDCACHSIASRFALNVPASLLHSLTLQTCWDSDAHPPLSVFVASNCEWFLVENEFGDCGWILITSSAVAPDLERICSIGSSALAAELGASGRAFAAPCSWVSFFYCSLSFSQLIYSRQANLLLLKPLLLAADVESTVFPCARPPLNQAHSLQPPMHCVPFFNIIF